MLSTMTTTPAPQRTGFLSFSKDTIIGDISFLILVGALLYVVAPSLPHVGQVVKRQVERL